MTKEIRKCPRCREYYDGFPALSRLDNVTSICSPCGVAEAIDDFEGMPLKDFLSEGATE
jgi:hypothetical protein